MSTVHTFTTLTANGSTESINLPRAASDFYIFLAGTPAFGGGLLTLQVSPDGGTTWLDYDMGLWSLRSAGLIGKFQLSGSRVRFTLSGAVTTASLTVQVVAKVKTLYSPKFLRFTESDYADLHIGTRPDTYNVFAYGTWDGATVTVYYTPDDYATMYSVGSASANAIIPVDNVADLGDFRVAVTSAGTSTDVQVAVYSH